MPVWESMEWSHISWSSPEKNERILFLGDSILDGYGGTVQNALKERFSIGKLISSKAVDNIYLIKEVELMIDEFGRNDSIKLVHLNNGLHGICQKDCDRLYIFCHCHTSIIHFYLFYAKNSTPFHIW